MYILVKNIKKIKLSQKNMQKDKLYINSLEFKYKIQR